MKKLFKSPARKIAAIILCVVLPLAGLASALIFVKPTRAEPGILTGANATTMDDYMFAQTPTNYLGNYTAYDATAPSSWRNYLNQVWRDQYPLFRWDTAPSVPDNFKWDGTVANVGSASNSLAVCQADPKAIPNLTGTVLSVYSGSQLAYAMQPAALSSGRTLKLMCDIDLKGYAANWTYKGNLDGVTIDGNGFTIYNLGSYNSSFTENFQNSTMKNLTFVSSKVVRSAAMVALIPIANSCTFSNVTMKNCLNFQAGQVANNSGSALLVANTRGNSSYTDVSVLGCSSYGYSHLGVMTGGMEYSTDVTRMERCIIADSTAVAWGAHFGGLAGCVYGAHYIKDSFVEMKAYVANLGGMLAGGGGQTTVSYENSFTAGALEIFSNGGGLFAVPSATNFSVINCYSAAMVGMQQGGTNIGGFMSSSTSSNNTLRDCYSVGEVGSIDTAVASNRTTHTTVGGFAYNLGTAAVGSFTNCYYDKQTSAMREWETGTTYDGGTGNIAGIKGVLTTDTVKSGAGLASTPGAVGFTGFTNNSSWVFAANHYPQLTVFANATAATWGSQEKANLVKAYSRASTSTVKLETWEKDFDGNPLPAATYDTVRDVVQAFPLTSADDTKWQRVGNGATLSNGSGNTTTVNGQTVPVLQLYPPEGNVYGASYQAHKLAPGIEWLRVSAKDGDQVGMRAMRVVPTSGLLAGSDAALKKDVDAYDHASGVQLLYSTGPRMAANTTDITAKTWPQLGGGTDLLNVPTTSLTAGSKVSVRLAQVLSIAADGSPILDTPIALSNDPAQTINKYLNNALPVGLKSGRYAVQYIWEFTDGRFMTDYKFIHLRNLTSGSKEAYLNGSPDAENGTPDDPVVVKKNDEIKYELTFDRSERFPPPTVDNPLFMPASTAAGAPTKINFINGSFEQPDTRLVAMRSQDNPWGGANLANPAGAYYDHSMVPGWWTVPTNASNIGSVYSNCIQYFCSYNAGGHGTAPFPSGEQFAELNASYPSRLYQICNTKNLQGMRIYWELSHEACQYRNGNPHGTGNLNSTDTLNVYMYATPEAPPAAGDSAANRATPPAGSMQMQCVTKVSDRWKQYKGMYSVPLGQEYTTLAFESPGSYSGDPAYGNYLDDIRVYTNSYLTLTKTNNAPGGKADVGDTVTLTTRVQNLGESDAGGTYNNHNVKFTDKMPIGTDFVPGSVKIDGNPANAVASFNATTNELTVELGYIKGTGSFSADCNNYYDVSYDVTVNGEEVAKNYKYENQAHAEYSDRGYESSGSPAERDAYQYLSYSNVGEFALHLAHQTTVVDYLPEGLQYVSHTTDAGGTFTNSGQKCTWNWADLNADSITLTVTAKVTAPLHTLYANRAWMEASYLPNIVYTNKTYHAPLPPDPPQKRSRVSVGGDGNYGPLEDNFTEATASVVKPGDWISYEITADTPKQNFPSRVANPAFATPIATSPHAPINFVNGSFEQPGSRGAQIPMASVPGWSTRPTSAADDSHQYAFCLEIDLPTTYGSGINVPDGRMFAELNAHVPGTLYQDCATVPGTKVYYEFYHRGRAGTDVMDFYLYGVPSTSVLTIPGRDGFTATAIQRCSDGTTAWGKYTGAYTVPAGQTLTRFAYQSVSAAGGSPAIGNFLDAIRLFTPSFLTLAQTNNAPGGKADFDDVVTYKVILTNSGESDASKATIVDVLPVGLEYRPGTAKVGGTAVPAANVAYDDTTRELRILAGLVKGVGSFSTDCVNNVEVTFDVKVTNTEIAENLKYENQATVVYEDRNYEADKNEYTNHSNVTEFALEIKQPGTITDVLPAGLTYQSHTPSAAGATTTNPKFTITGQTVKWEWDNMPGGETTVTVQVKVDKAMTLYDNKAVLKIDEVMPPAGQETNHIFHKAQYILHLRQIVLDPATELETPLMGFLRLQNDTPPEFLPLTCNSGTANTLDFSDYRLIAGQDPVYPTMVFVPQYYMYAGYRITDTEAANVPPPVTAQPNGSIPVDFTNAGELWVTVYLKPNGKTPEDRDEDYRTNWFGGLAPKTK